MSAINPFPPAGTSSDKRSYEPSMEEILASIRRIIADDQGLPSRGGPIGDPASTVESSHELLRMPVPPRLAAPAPADPAASPAVQRPPEPPFSPAPPPLAPADEDPTVPHGIAAHGPIAAPQYPAPDGRIGGGDGGMTPIAEAPAAPEPIPPAADRFDDASEAPTSRHAQTSAPAPLEKEDEMFDAPIEPKPASEAMPLFSASTDAAVSSAFSMLAASRLADNSEELMTIAKEMIRPMLRAWLDDNLPSMVERMVRAEIERVARGGR